MSNYRTAMGKSVDMGSLIARNEKTRAVGNMNVNARGDTIDAHGRIVKSVTEKVSDKYAKTVGNRSANVVKKPNTLQPDAPKPAEIDLSELNPIERELEESLEEEEIEIEKIKEEVKKATKKK
jgi:hypothetical protein